MWQRRSHKMISSMWLAKCAKCANCANCADMEVEEVTNSWSKTSLRHRRVCPGVGITSAVGNHRVSSRSWTAFNVLRCQGLWA